MTTAPDPPAASHGPAGVAEPPLTADLVAAYLDRIGHPPVATADLATLTTLQDAHVRAVPFENLDIHLGVPLSLDLADLADKVIHRRRGGFCFELNGLFAALLTSLGFEVQLIEARHLLDDGSRGDRFDHARVLVSLEDRPWVADVGTGASPRGPLHLDPGAQQIGHVRYRTTSRDEFLVTERWDDDAWQTGWSFDLTPVPLAAFEERCRYHQTSPDSHFTQKPLCTLVTEDGHVTLSERTLIVTRGGLREERTIDDPLTELRQRFGVTLPRWPGG